MKVVDPSELMLDFYYKGRARHFLNDVLVPLIRREVKNPSSDVSGSPAIGYMVTAIRGSKAEDDQTRRLSSN